MSSPFSSSEFDYSYFESPGHMHSDISSNYGYHHSSIFDQDNSESEFHLSYSNVHYPTLHESTPKVHEQYYAVENAHAFDSQFPSPSDEVQPAVYSWPVEYFVAPAGADFVSESFGLPSPTNSSTPELDYSAPSTSSIHDTSNVFDMYFGAALDSNPCHQQQYNMRSTESSSPISDDSFTRASPRSPIRTPSPPSDSASTSSSAQLDHRRRFPCLLPGCSRRFTSQYTLKVHTEAHRPKPKVSFPCTLGCSERFSRQHDRLRHEVAKHGKVCEFSCHACGRFFSTSKTLGNHRCPVAQGSTRWVNS
ncbi:hypothetical protein F5878DRAFT_635675 [Lentinula raphanica]|uniref:C2H2-type domain-containing protein n=1 Tax=Lentinula raphanica TaxID=153919 RepID=A0AA38NWX5_9AGAR|nr:hypothetical protein F5878DRAFT_635675 [Lentinula raphanica]